MTKCPIYQTFTCHVYQSFIVPSRLMWNTLCMACLLQFKNDNLIYKCMDNMHMKICLPFTSSPTEFYLVGNYVLK